MPTTKTLWVTWEDGQSCHLSVPAEWYTRWQNNEVTLMLTFEESTEEDIKLTSFKVEYQ